MFYLILFLLRTQLHQLSHLHSVWKEALPRPLYLRAMAVLVDQVLLALADAAQAAGISAEDARYATPVVHDLTGSMRM